SYQAPLRVSVRSLLTAKLPSNSLPRIYWLATFAVLLRSRTSSNEERCRSSKLLEKAEMLNAPLPFMKVVFAPTSTVSATSSPNTKSRWGGRFVTAVPNPPALKACAHLTNVDTVSFGRQLSTTWGSTRDVECSPTRTLSRAKSV